MHYTLWAKITLVQHEPKLLCKLTSKMTCFLRLCGTQQRYKSSFQLFFFSFSTIFFAFQEEKSRTSGIYSSLEKKMEHVFQFLHLSSCSIWGWWSLAEFRKDGNKFLHILHRKVFQTYFVFISMSKLVNK